MLRSGLLALMQTGAKLNVPDSDGRDAMSYAVLSNNTALAAFLLKNRKEGQLQVDNRDRGGKNAVHLLVKPCKFGSYENAALLRDLLKAGYKPDELDADKKRPIDYARSQKSGVLLEVLSNGQELPEATVVRKAADWPKCVVSFEGDSEAFMKEAQEKEEREAQENESIVKELAPVDSVGEFDRGHTVYCEGTKPWDAYLTKVDLKNGIYGENNFYKL